MSWFRKRLERKIRRFIHAQVDDVLDWVLDELLTRYRISGVELILHRLAQKIPHADLERLLLDYLHKEHGV